MMALAADHGWQVAPVTGQKGQRILVEASGQYRLQNNEQWISEADGVTIDYYRGVPLGSVIACVVPQIALDAPYLPKLDVVNIGARGEAVAPCDGWLLLKVNDRPNSLADNDGSLELRFQLVVREVGREKP